MTLIAVAADKFARGVDEPGAPIKGIGSATYDWREEPGSPGNTAPVFAHYEVLDLRKALEQRYSSDAHLVTYYLLSSDGVPLRRQPRIRKTALPWLLSQGYSVEVDTLFCDGDNPGHIGWTEELLDDFRNKLDSLEVLSTSGYYTTAHGYRFIQPLDEPVVAAEAERYIVGWLHELEDAGIAVDWGCKDWTRHFRAPYVRRDGRRTVSAMIDLGRAAPRIVRPAPAASPKAAGKKRSRVRRVGSFADELPETWKERVYMLAAALRDRYQGIRHTMGLCLAGALLERRVAPEAVPAIVKTATSLAGWDSQHHRSGAEDTVRRAAQGHSVRSDVPPELVGVLDEVTSQIPMVARSLAEEQDRLYRAIRDAGDGLTIIKAPCGIGKSQQARRVAIERAAQGRKTVISVPTNELAEQFASYLRADGLKVCRYFGPASLRGADKKYVCAYRKTAAHLANGFQSVHWELCEGRRKDKCQFFDNCRAKDGCDGDPSAPIVVGNHGLLGELLAAAGKKGLLVIDEPADFIVEEALNERSILEVEFDIAAGHFCQGRRFLPALALARAYLSQGKLDEAAKLFEVQVEAPEIGMLLDDVQADSASEAVLEAIRPPRRAPTINRMTVSLAKIDEDLANRIGRSSKILTLLQRALTDESVRVVAFKQYMPAVPAEKWPRRLAVVAMDGSLAAALRKDGSVVAMAADADIYLRDYERVVCYSPAFVEIHATDGCQVRRLLMTAKLPKRRGIPGKWLVRKALEAAAEGLGPVPRLALVTHLDWQEKLAELAYAWAKERGSAVAVGHYYALRGLDCWKDHDALVTIGDPIKNLGAIGRMSAELNCDTSERAEAMARAELEQCHGRLRVVHRQGPCTMVHVGRVVPAGWHRYEHDELDVEAGALREIVDAVGGNRAAARVCSVSPATVHRWLQAESRPPGKVEALLRNAIAQQGAEAPNKVRGATS